MRNFYFAAFWAFSYTTWAYLHVPVPTILSIRVEQPFYEVVKNSSFPVMASSNVPNDTTGGSGATWVTKPSVVIHFNDPEHGFTLPPTTFAAVSYNDYRVSSIETSPMSEKLPFSETMALVGSLQRQFQTKGWQLEENEEWIDLGTSHRDAFHAVLREHGHWIAIKVPGKYSMFFGLHCFEQCDSRTGLDRYLIDMSIGRDLSLNIAPTKHTVDGQEK